MAFDFGPLNEACRDTFGEEVTFTPAGGSGEVVIGVQIDPATLEGISPGVALAMFFNVSDLSQAPVAGDVITIGSTDYEVVGEPKLDGGDGVRVCLVEKRS